VAVLQATNTFVAGDLEIPQPDHPETGSAGPSDRFRRKPSDSSMPSDSGKRSGSSRPLESPGPKDPSQRSDSPRPPDSSTPSDSSDEPAPDDYVSEVLSRILSTRRRDRTPPPSG
jgi:hypothetical protein